MRGEREEGPPAFGVAEGVDLFGNARLKGFGLSFTFLGAVVHSRRLCSSSSSLVGNRFFVPSGKGNRWGACAPGVPPELWRDKPGGRVRGRLEWRGASATYDEQAGQVTKPSQLLSRSGSTPDLGWRCVRFTSASSRVRKPWCCRRVFASERFVWWRARQWSRLWRHCACPGFVCLSAGRS